ncbi:reverse transcriptase [Triplophysa rosa]|uniref:Reverse transcriptase n=1 Tax=Triplophysa rosa TaxID=992332 RepID=A0A9W8CB78_TRIRA|nr:reverse transcriptase [Triplophysa rosa]
MDGVRGRGRVRMRGGIQREQGGGRGQGQLGHFSEELDTLLSSFPVDDTPLVELGDFNIHLEKPQAANFNNLTASFDLKRVPTTATHKSDTTHASPLVTFRRNLRSLSPSRLSSEVSSTLPPSEQLSLFDTNSATDTLCSTQTSCLDNLCPLTSRPSRASPSAPWLSDVLCEHRAMLRSAERKWCKSKEPADLGLYQSLLSSFSADVSSPKTQYYQAKIKDSPDSRTLFKTFSALFCPPAPSPPSNLTADNFASLFVKKTTTISSQFPVPELLVIPTYTKIHHNFSIQLGSSTITSSRTARNLGVVIDDQLNFTDQVASTTRSCRFILYNIRKIRPFLSEHATQVLVQALVLSRLDYCNALLAGLPVARIKFKTLLLAYKTTTDLAPPYLHLLMQTCIPARSLRSANERRLVVPSQKGSYLMDKILQFASQEKQALHLLSNIETMSADRQSDITLLELPVVLPTSVYKIGRKMFRPTCIETRSVPTWLNTCDQDAIEFPCSQA